jgi:hypothetical protein
VSGWLRHVYSPWMEWYWQCLLLPLLYKTGALLACAMSAMLTSSEVGTGGVWMAASCVQSLDGVVLAVSPPPPPLQDGGRARVWHVCHAHLVRGRYRRCLAGCVTCTVPGWSGTGSVSCSPSFTRRGPCSPVACPPCSPGQRYQALRIRIRDPVPF